MKFTTFILLCLTPVALHAELSEPRRVIEADVPHAAPTIADVDGDGLRDLVVGLYRDDPYTGARVQWFRNVGTNALPSYAPPVWLQAGGRDASVDEFCHTGAGPQFVDFNGDGLLDLVSGSRDCQLHVFARRADGTFDTATQLAYASASDLRYNSRVLLHDWDQDGDHDLLATRRKAIWWVPNLANAKTADFGVPEQLLTLQPGQQGFSSCAIADWNNDGKRDLVAGLWDGSVVWYRNESSEAGAPKLSLPAELVGPGDSYSVPMDNERNYVQPNRPAGHVRVCVADYNDDGLVDLLVGDAWASVQTYDKNNPRPKLTAEQMAERKKAYAKENSLRRAFDELQEAPVGETVGARLVRFAKLDTIRPRCAAAWQARYAGSSHIRHGSVWLFQRVAPKARASRKRAL